MYKKLLLALIALVSISGQTLAAEQPNILWILAEDFSQDLGAYGNDVVRTPHMDALAAKGMRFDHMYTTASVCAPSRTALATGVYPTRYGAHHMRIPNELAPELPNQFVPVSELFRRNGYVTALLKDNPSGGKTDYSFKKNKLAKFDYKHWNELKNSDKPFFAVSTLYLTHRPFKNDKAFPVDPTIVKVPPYFPDNDIVRRDIADYYETAQNLDRLVGKVMKQLKANGLDKNTIVMFFSDHGAPMPRAKSTIYDSGTRIPFIVMFPEGMKVPDSYLSGGVDERLLSAIDIPATSLALAGIEVPESMDGQAFYGGKPRFEREYVISHLDRIGDTHYKSRSIRTKDHRLIINLNHGFSRIEDATAYIKGMHPIFHVINVLAEQGKLTDVQKTVSDPFAPIELFDMNRDPFEVNNIAGTKEVADIEIGLRKKLWQWMIETEDKGLIPDSPEMRKAFDDYRIYSHKRMGKQINRLDQKVRTELEVH